MLRQHQKDLHQLARRIRSGELSCKRIIAEVTPGGGKSILPVILAHELIGSRAQKICWIVPRTALQEQAEESFTDPFPRKLLGHKHVIRANTNDTDPSRGLSGYVTTYAALTVDGKKTNAIEFTKHKYILVLDEPHHVAEGSAYETALRPLVENAVLVLYMSGTLERDDQRHIAFLPYKRVPTGRAIDFKPTAETAVVQYSRSEALREKAIIRLYFNHVDAQAEWIDGEGVKQSVRSLAHTGEGYNEALWTALNTQYAISLIDKTLADWRLTRAVNKRSKLLVVAARQNLAKTYADFLKSRGVRTGVATMEEGDGAQKAIQKFKSTAPASYEALVTVQMAYEGLDVKPITHIACLTNIRSKPWIEQMLARATRFDKEAGPWEKQYAHVFLPDDPVMREIIADITESDGAVVKEKGKGAGGFGGEGPSKPPAEIIPIASGATADRASELLSEDEAALLEQAMQAAGVTGLTPRQLKQIIQQAGYERPGSTPQEPEKPILTPSQEEEQLKTRIETHVRQYAIRHGKDFKKLNAKIVEKFGKSRSKMTLIELRKVYAWVKARYPMDNLFLTEEAG